MARRDPAPPPPPPKGRASRAPAAPAGKRPRRSVRARLSADSRAQSRTRRKDKRARRGAQLKAMRRAWSETRRYDRRMPLVVLGSGLLVALVVGVLVGWLAGWFFGAVMGLMLGLTVALFLFSRRANSAIFGQVEGQAGIAPGVVERMRGDWRVQPAVAANRQSDLVHRVLGRPGLVLLTEGDPGRVRPLVLSERRRVVRALGDFPVYEVHVGDEESGGVPLKRLARHLSSLPRNVKGAQINAAERRLGALLAKGAVPLPKGPLPTGGKVPRPPKGMR